MYQVSNKKPAVPAPAVGRAFSVLGLLAEKAVPLGVTQIAAALDLSKATVHALVHALAAAGALEAAANKKYRLGPVLVSLAEARSRPLSLEQVCRPLLEALADELHQTAILGTKEGARLRILAVAEGNAELRIGATPGLRIPAHAGAHGKVLRAWSSPDPDGLSADLADTRRLGLAFDRGEYIEGVVAAAAPVIDGNDRVLGVLYVVGLHNLIDEEVLQHVGERVREAARVASRRLAGSAH